MLYRQAIHLRELGEVEALKGVLEALCQSHPSHRRTIWAAGELQRMALEQEEFEDSLRWYEVLASARPRSVPSGALWARAQALLKLERADEALPTLERLAQRGDSLRGQALARAGAVHDTAGRAQTAVEAYRGALDAGLPADAAEWIRSRLAALTEPERQQPPQSAPAGSEGQAPGPGQPHSAETETER